MNFMANFMAMLDRKAYAFLEMGTKVADQPPPTRPRVPSRIALAPAANRAG